MLSPEKREQLSKRMKAFWAARRKGILRKNHPPSNMGDSYGIKVSEFLERHSEWMIDVQSGSDILDLEITAQPKQKHYAVDAGWPYHGNEWELEQLNIRGEGRYGANLPVYDPEEERQRELRKKQRKEGKMKTAKEIEGVTVDGKPLVVYLDEQQSTEIQRSASREISQKAAGINYQPASGKFGNISGARTERKDIAGSIAISEETAAHINFLIKYKGEEAMHDFLSSANEQKQLGPVENAIHETREKLILLRKKQIELSQEVTKYDAILNGLQDVLNLQLGKTRAVPALTSSENSNQHPVRGGRGWRLDKIKELLLAGGVVAKKEVWRKLEEEQHWNKKDTYAAVYNSIKKGFVEESDGLLSWIGK